MIDRADDRDDALLEVRGLKTYFFLRSGTARAVDGVDLTIRRGRTLGLVGESGSGKSVTAMSMMRLVKSPPGRIVDGRIVFRRPGLSAVDLVSLKADGKQMRSVRGGEIAMIFQEPMTSLNPLYTVGRQIAEAVRLHHRVGRREARRRALAMLDRVQIGDPSRRLREYPHQLSGGMRQRVMIAMALSCHPALLIADEPTTALDVTVQAQILELLGELQADLGTAILLITHNLGVIAQTADEVAVMYLGKIVEHAGVRELFRSPHHPYTEGLLASVPVFGRKRRELRAIRGTAPECTERVPGCPFAGRCPRKMETCRQKAPGLKDVSPGHQVACWLY